MERHWPASTVVVDAWRYLDVQRTKIVSCYTAAVRIHLSRQSLILAGPPRACIRGFAYAPILGMVQLGLRIVQLRRRRIHSLSEVLR
jgi:hypothetical protein